MLSRKCSMLIENFMLLPLKINLSTSFFLLSNLQITQDTSLKFKKTALVPVVNHLLTTKKTFKKSKKHQLLTTKNGIYRNWQKCRKPELGKWSKLMKRGRRPKNDRKNSKILYYNRPKNIRSSKFREKKRRLRPKPLRQICATKIVLSAKRKVKNRSYHLQSKR